MTVIKGSDEIEKAFKRFKIPSEYGWLFADVKTKKVSEELLKNLSPCYLYYYDHSKYRFKKAFGYTASTSEQSCFSLVRFVEVIMAKCILLLLFKAMLAYDGHRKRWKLQTEYNTKCDEPNTNFVVTIVNSESKRSTKENKERTVIDKFIVDVGSLFFNEVKCLKKAHPKYIIEPSLTECNYSPPFDFEGMHERRGKG